MIKEIIQRRCKYHKFSKVLELCMELSLSIGSLLFYFYSRMFFVFHHFYSSDFRKIYIFHLHKINEENIDTIMIYCLMMYICIYPWSD